MELHLGYSGAYRPQKTTLRNNDHFANKAHYLWLDWSWKEPNTLNSNPMLLKIVSMSGIHHLYLWL